VRINFTNKKDQREARWRYCVTKHFKESQSDRQNLRTFKNKNISKEAAQYCFQSNVCEQLPM